MKTAEITAAPAERTAEQIISEVQIHLGIAYPSVEADPVLARRNNKMASRRLSIALKQLEALRNL